MEKTVSLNSFSLDVALKKKASEKTYLITGGAGFIGSNLAAALSTRGAKIIINDRFRSNNKWKNLLGVNIEDVIYPEYLRTWLSKNSRHLDAIIHMGAISATTEKDVDKIITNNFILSSYLWEVAKVDAIPFIYASSAATYGSGENGFNDDQSITALNHLRPLNPYGWSKLIFDQKIISNLIKHNHTPPQWVGLKFFNVYGPNEAHKGDMRSVINKVYPQVRDNETISLFKSHVADYKDGGQLRDFIYVKDCVKIILWLLENKKVSGIFNVGTGTPRSFDDLVKSVGMAVGVNPKIQYIDMPVEIRNSYQYYTRANIEKLRNAGYAEDFYTLETGVNDYVHSHLIASS